MRGLRSGLALHALAVHAERDQPPTRPTRTPVVGLVRALATPVQDFSCFIRIRQRASRQGRFRRRPTAIAARALRSPTAFWAFPQGLSISQEYSALLQGMDTRRQ